MRHYITILILTIGFLSTYSQESNFKIKGEVISCSDTKDKPSGYIYLLKDSVVIDSVWTYHQTLFGDICWTNGKFKFKGLQNGIYQIKYDTYFDTQDFPTFEINGSDLKGIKICYDKLPDRLYKEETSLDRLEINDTLFINVYIAAGGEFGGYDEGFWIIKGQDEFKGRFYSLPNTYAIQQRDTAKVIAKYKNNFADIKPITNDITLSQSDVLEIKKFLIEINHYNDNWISNAPEHFLIYGKNEMIYRIKNNSHYQPYIDLRKLIKNGL